MIHGLLNAPLNIRTTGPRRRNGYRTECSSVYRVMREGATSDLFLILSIRQRGNRKTGFMATGIIQQI